jgi:hypothetical protein
MPGQRGSSLPPGQQRRPGRAADAGVPSARHSGLRAARRPKTSPAPAAPAGRPVVGFAHGPAQAAVPWWFSGGSGDMAVSGVPGHGCVRGECHRCRPRTECRGDSLSGVVDTGEDGAGVCRPVPAAAAVHDNVPVGLQPGDHPAHSAVAAVGFAGDGGRRWPAAGAVVARVRVRQREQDQALVAGRRRVRLHPVHHGYAHAACLSACRAVAAGPWQPGRLWQVLGRRADDPVHGHRDAASGSSSLRRWPPGKPGVR